MPWRRTDKKKKKNEEKTKKNDLKIPLMIKIIKILLKRESLVLSATCHLGGGELCNSFNIYFN